MSNEDKIKIRELQEKLEIAKKALANIAYVEMESSNVGTFNIAFNALRDIKAVQ